MAGPARNSLKGYTYQQSVFTMFVSLMDAFRKIQTIEVEALDTKNFDDLYLQIFSDDNEIIESYRLQVKNYPKASLDDISISENCLTINKNKNYFDPTDNNILIVSSGSIQTDDTFMDLPCIKKDGITIIPLTPSRLHDKIDGLFKENSRELQIINLALTNIESANFVLSINDLPQLPLLTTDLDEKTTLVRSIPKQFPSVLTFIEGKPGIGKSHYVSELCNNFPDAIVYRFWISSQDNMQSKRLNFDTFIIELGKKIFKTPQNFELENLISTIKTQHMMLIIDGLDHVENYNPLELEKYISFIDQLKNTSTIVLSRPLRHPIYWEKIILIDWSLEETCLYLENAYNIHDYAIQKEIYNITKGYPIITYYVCEDYQLTNQLNFTSPIPGINEYYDSLLLINNSLSESMGIFATGTCFFTYAELSTFFESPEMSDIINQFILQHPYLFKIVRNRVSLLHDSFNTYLRLKLKYCELRKIRTLEIIKQSILGGSIEYMARMRFFEFDEEFYRQILLKYSDSKYFEQLMLSTVDYNSITEFYYQLRDLLSCRNDVLDIYGHYSFALLFQIATRNDLIGCESLVYQLLLYLHTHGHIENSIFSSDYIWTVYLTCCQQPQYLKNYLESIHYCSSQYSELLYTIKKDQDFFNKASKTISYESFIATISSSDFNDMDKAEALSDYLMSIRIHGKNTDPFYESFDSFLTEQLNDCPEIQYQLSGYGYDKMWTNWGLNMARYRLYELGMLEDQNPFLNTTLWNLIKSHANRGSYEVVTYVASYLKLANHKGWEIDINSVAYCWSMYYNRKDYSVITIDDALITFEEKGLTTAATSFLLIRELMKQSEKGISHLLSSYVNKKGPKVIKELGCRLFLSSLKSSINFFELDAKLLDTFNSDIMAENLYYLRYLHRYGTSIEFKSIKQAMQSTHKDLVLDILSDYTIIDAENSVIQDLEAHHIKYLIKDAPDPSCYKPFEHGFIHEEDLIHVNPQEIGYLEIANYADGWYACLPFVNIFSLYPLADIQKDCNLILHAAMYANIHSKHDWGYWYELIGHIPAFLNQYSIDVDWGRIFSIFQEFLRISLIKYKDF